MDSAIWLGAARVDGDLCILMSWATDELVRVCADGTARRAGRVRAAAQWCDDGAEGRRWQRTKWLEGVYGFDHESQLRTSFVDGDQCWTDPAVGSGRGRALSLISEERNARRYQDGSRVLRCSL
ncbi:MAG: hypothetical protein AAF645_26605 [Myxococcota bacterium]